MAEEEVEDGATRTGTNVSYVILKNVRIEQRYFT